MPPTTPVHVRIDTAELAKLEQSGQQSKPKPLNRSEMINVAVREYNARRARKAGARQPAGAAAQEG